jgi:membrane fusion protein (multidrug efflux system)
MTGALAYKKFLQLQEMGAQNSAIPPPISVVVARAEPAQWNKRIKAIGTLNAYRGVDIASEVSGVVKSINFESGQEVEAGTLLVELNNRSELARLAAAKAKFEADNSQNERLLKLKDKDFVTNNDLDTQASLVDIARSQIGIARAALAKKSISAPFSGKLGIRQIDVGKYITPGTPIVTLQSVDRLLLDFTLPESNFKDLAVGQSIDFKVRSYPDVQFSAQVKAWNPMLDENTRNVTIRAEVDNRQGKLAPGMFAEMEVTGNRKVPVLTVPETSIFYNIYGEAVYALEKPEATETDSNPAYILAAHQVKVAYRVDGMVGITEGIKAGDLIVTAGQLKLYPSLKVTIVDDVPEYRRSSTTVQ